MADFGDFALGCSFSKQVPDKFALLVKLEFFGLCPASPGTSQFDAFRFFPCERFPRPLRNQAAFDFRGKPEGECENLALDVVAQAVSVLDGPYAAFLRHADSEDFHNHEKVPSQSGKFAADDDVAGMDFLQQFAEPPLVVIFAAAACFLDPSADFHFSFLAKISNFETLVFDGLPFARNANISVNHSDSCGDVLARMDFTIAAGEFFGKPECFGCLPFSGSFPPDI